MFSFGMSKQKSKQEASTFVDPTQQPFREDIYGQAQNLYQEGMPDYQVAGLNENIATGLTNQANVGGAQVGAGSALLGQGLDLSTGSTSALNFANQAMDPNSLASSIGTGIAGGATAAQNVSTADAAQNLGFDQSNLNRYINNEVLNNQIQAATRDVERNFLEQAMPSIGSAAAAAGASGSSRAGVLEGLALRGAQDRAGDIAANIRSNAYNRALNIESQRASQNALMNQQANIFNAGQANTLFSGGMNLGMNALRNQQFGATLASNIGQGGVRNVQAGGDIAASGFGNQIGSGEYSRNYNQQLLDTDRLNMMNPFAALEFYNTMIGDPTVLSKSKGTSSGSSFNLGFGKG